MFYHIFEVCSDGYAAILEITSVLPVMLPQEKDLAELRAKKAQERFLLAKTVAILGCRSGESMRSLY